MEDLLEKMGSNQKLVQITHKHKHYYILPSKEELKKLNMEGKLMPLNPDMKILDDLLKTFDDTYKIKELVEKNKIQRRTKYRGIQIKEDL